MATSGTGGFSMSPRWLISKDGVEQEVLFPYPVDEVAIRRQFGADVHARPVPPGAPRCDECQGYLRPGLVGRYCGRRGDLPIAYGRLRNLPADGGASCLVFERRDEFGSSGGSPGE